jgi:hypothetical protein
MECNEPAPYKLTFPEGHADWYCKHHYEFMASIIRAHAENSNPKDRRRAQRCMEMNNYFQHE